MVRVIAGTFRSRLLKTLEGKTTRPTSDRLKETLFNLLQDRIEGSRFLDCFSGSGSVGIEALSRGAGFVVFVESSAKAVRVNESNLHSLKLSDRGSWRIIGRPWGTALKILHNSRLKFDIVFLDPPYSASEQYASVMGGLQTCQLLDDSALVIAEHARRFELNKRVLCLTRFREVRQGDSQLSLFRQEGTVTDRQGTQENEATVDA